MRRTLAAAAVLSIALGATSAPAEACGDKLLVIGRRVKRVPQAKHPASVLLYLRPGSALPKAAEEMHLEAILLQAGHRVDTVDGAQGLDDLLARGRYDFVLTDLPDAAVVAREAASTPEAPAIVPVASDVDEEVLRASRDRYQVVIEAGRSRSYLSDLDAAMGKRVQQQ